MFFLLFCMLEGSGFESGSVSLTNGSGRGSRRPKTYGSYGSRSATLPQAPSAVLRDKNLFFKLFPDSHKLWSLSIL
jgi:hypothetical protein